MRRILWKIRFPKRELYNFTPLVTSLCIQSVTLQPCSSVSAVKETEVSEVKSQTLNIIIGSCIDPFDTDTAFPTAANTVFVLEEGCQGNCYFSTVFYQFQTNRRGERRS